MGTSSMGTSSTGTASMGFVSYAPAPDEAAVTRAFGMEFRAGAVIEVDAGIYAKLRAHPKFSTGEDAGAPATAPPHRARARAPGLAALHAEAAQRARDHAADLADAAGEKPATG